MVVDVDLSEAVRRIPTPFYPSTVKAPSDPLKLFPFLIKFISNPLLVIPDAVYREKIVQYGRRVGRVAWVNDPALIKDVLLDRSELFPITPLQKRVLGPLGGKGVLTSEGAEWRWQRQMAAPLFRHAELLRYVPAMSSAAEAMLAGWSDDASGGYRSIDKDMTRLTFRVISDTVLPGGDEHIGRAIERASGDYFGSISWTFVYRFFHLPWWAPHPGRRRMLRAEKFLRTSVAELIAARKASPASRNDLFGRLSEAKHPETGEPMSADLLRDSLLTFMMVGHETTAKALTWMLYLLSQSEEWAEKLRDEIKTVAGAEPIGPQHIDRLQLTQQVVKEALRLYPPVPSITRHAAADLELGGQQILAGTLINIPIFALHRHRGIWRDPDCFDPSRFTPEAEAKISRTQFMPFGAGPRTCIGASFAMIEATAVLATLIRGARFRLKARHLPTPVSRVSLAPKGGMPMRVEVN
ncbi:MAG TPA: cytochrome P450 [Xanthobacteraceae bacterium]|nr:cytochrome P450 [Xanthobacteraceae bacterium]